MRIDDLNRTPVAPSGEKAGPAAHERIPEQGSAAGSDHAEVSHLAQVLAVPDPGRIEQLRLEVQAGTYNVSAAAVAKALVNAHLINAPLSDARPTDANRTDSNRKD